MAIPRIQRLVVSYSIVGSSKRLKITGPKLRSPVEYFGSIHDVRMELQSVPPPVLCELPNAASSPN